MRPPEAPGADTFTAVTDPVADSTPAPAAAVTPAPAPAAAVTPAPAPAPPPAPATAADSAPASAAHPAPAAAHHHLRRGRLWIGALVAGAVVLTAAGAFAGTVIKSPAQVAADAAAPPADVLTAPVERRVLHETV